MGTPWPGQDQGLDSKLKLSITYDGSSSKDIDLILPQLEQFGLKATFFVNPKDILERLEDWKYLAGCGHEIGNGTLLRAALPNGCLSHWTLKMIYDEVFHSEKLLNELFGADRPRLFAYPKGLSLCQGDQNYTEVLAPFGLIERLGCEGSNDLRDASSKKLRSYFANALTFLDLMYMIEISQGQPKWLILNFESDPFAQHFFHVGTHARFLSWLSKKVSRVELVPLSYAIQLHSFKNQSEPKLRMEEITVSLA